MHGLTTGPEGVNSTNSMWGQAEYITTRPPDFMRDTHGLTCPEAS